MARFPRFIPPDSLVEVTCRTVQGRFLLEPMPSLNQIPLGALGRAQSRYGVKVHAFVFMSNHYHLLLTAESAQQLAAFMGHLNAKIAKEAGRLYGWREKFWGRRYQAILVTGEEGAQIARLKYVLAHGVKEGLVDNPAYWPGAHCVDALLNGAVV